MPVSSVIVCSEEFHRSSVEDAFSSVKLLFIKALNLLNVLELSELQSTRDVGLVRSSWKTQTLARSDKNLLASSAATIQKKSTNGLLVSHLRVFNAYLSYTATMLNIVAIYAIRKTLSLPKNLKTLLLSLAVSDLGVGLLAQPMHVAYIMDYKQNNVPSDSVIYIAFLITTNLFMFASLFGVTALCAERFLAIYLHLRYQELVTCKRVAAVVVSIWVISAIISLIRFFIPKNIMYVSFVIIISACIVTATSLSVKLYLTLRRHINQIQVQQVAQNDQGESV